MSFPSSILHKTSLPGWVLGCMQDKEGLQLVSVLGQSMILRLQAEGQNGLSIHNRSFFDITPLVVFVNLNQQILDDLYHMQLDAICHHFVSAVASIFVRMFC
jgi:hypothetical protein